MAAKRKMVALVAQIDKSTKSALKRLADYRTRRNGRRWTVSDVVRDMIDAGFKREQPSDESEASNGNS